MADTIPDRASVASRCAAGRPPVHHLQSPALAGRGDLAIFAPAAVATVGEDVPLVVLLHGVYGSFWNWAFNGGAPDVLSGLMAAGAVGPMVLAMPCS